MTDEKKPGGGTGPDPVRSADYSTLVDQACKLADEGWHVFPVANKEPLVKWRDVASDQLVDIDRMPWDRATHIGVECERSGLAVVDVDDMSALAVQPLPMTRMQITPRGGRHYIYQAPKLFEQRNTTGAPVKGIDIRGAGGFIVWYGQGEMVADPIQPWPFKAAIGAVKGRAEVAWTPGPVSVGGRNHDLISAGGFFMHKYPSADIAEVIAYLVGHTTLHHSPPLPLHEVRTTAASAMRWRKEAVQGESEEYFGKILTIPAPPPPRAICGDWMRERSYTIFHAQAGFGKTATVADMVYCMKNGLKWMGQPTQDPGRILWINGDMPNWQLKERLGYINDYVDLWHMQFVDLMRTPELLIGKCEGYGMAILDNRAALLQLADAMSAEAWASIGTTMRTICNNGTATLLQTHAAKAAESSGPFGSSAQVWVADAVVGIGKLPQKIASQYENSPVKPRYQLQWDKCRLGSIPEPVPFMLAMNNNRLEPRWQEFAGRGNE